MISVNLCKIFKSHRNQVVVNLFCSFIETFMLSTCKKLAKIEADQFCCFSVSGGEKPKKKVVPQRARAVMLQVTAAERLERTCVFTLLVTRGTKKGHVFFKTFRAFVTVNYIYATSAPLNHMSSQKYNFFRTYNRYCLRRTNTNIIVFVGTIHKWLSICDVTPIAPCNRFCPPFSAVYIIYIDI